jgi:S1-C subfamily serine protease
MTNDRGPISKTPGVARISAGDRQTMVRIMWCLVILVVGTVVAACGQSLYRQWGNQLNELARGHRTSEDVSMLLGTPPSHCEVVSNPAPVIGASIEQDQVVASVVPNGPAAMSGLRAGDRIVRVNDQPIANRAQLAAAFRDSARAEEPLNLETQRGTVSVIPRVPNKAEQCSGTSRPEG